MLEAQCQEMQLVEVDNGWPLRTLFDPRTGLVYKMVEWVARTRPYGWEVFSVAGGLPIHLAQSFEGQDEAEAWLLRVAGASIAAAWTDPADAH